MIKHVGRQGDRRVAIVFREVPNEEHMALVVYPDTMPVSMHDALMAAIESEPGQQANSLADVLNRNLFPDGRNMLQTLHAEGMLKKVRTSEIVVVANATSNVILEEMNKIIAEMESGAAAMDRLAELENNRGMTGTVGAKDEFGREIGAPNAPVNSAQIAGSDADLTARDNAALQQQAAAANEGLDDTAIASSLAAQAKQMEIEAKSLLAESKRLSKEAAQLAPKKKAAAKTTRGRKKAVTANGAN